MQPKVGNLDQNFEYFTEEDYLDEGYARTADGTMRREETYRDERHLRTETRPVRSPSSFQHVDSLALARAAKRLKYSRQAWTMLVSLRKMTPACLLAPHHRPCWLPRPQFPGEGEA